MHNNNSNKPLVISYLRWSSGQQKLGDSERRQLAEAQEWLKEKGYELDEQLTIKDDGKSGYYSENFSENGALGKFYAEVQMGKIPKGTVLIIEDFSRFSRAHVGDAQKRFLDLIYAGITIYVTKDKTEYKKEGLELTNLIISLAKMAAAHEESARKSYHLTKFWESARKKATKRITDDYPVLLPSQAPYWLKKVEKNGHKYFEIIPERVETVKLIFQLADCGGHDGLGLGSTLIVRYLEEKDIKPFKGEKQNTATSFNDSYVLRLIKDQRLLGFFQPHINPIDLETGKRKRIPQGSPIPDYFPPIIDQELFDRVNMKVKQRKSYTGGKVAKKFGNLFTKIVKCAYCGHSMTLFTKRGSMKEGGRSAYLQCSEGTKHLKCGNKAVRYHDTFEKSVISSLRELDLSFLFSNDSNQDQEKITQVTNKKLQLEHELSDVENDVNNATKLVIKHPDDEDIYNEKLKLNQKQKLLIKQIEDISNELISLRRNNSVQEFRNNLSIVLDTQDQDDTLESYFIRKSINTALIDITQFIAIDGVKQTAWLVFKKHFIQNLIRESFYRSSDLNYQIFFEGKHELLEELPPTLPSEEEIKSFGTSIDSLHLKIKLKRFEDKTPSYQDVLSMRECYQIAPDELIKITKVCNNAINKSWSHKNHTKYEVVDFEDWEKLTNEVYQEFYFPPPEDDAPDIPYEVKYKDNSPRPEYKPGDTLPPIKNRIVYADD